ncbi:MAG TPA: RNA polymerase sigma factor [Bacillota bacterium]|nr:RNA polymerase sigma factor [Bacillota bacterium]
MHEDLLLVEAIKAGRTDRFEELVDKYKNKVHNMACHMTESLHEGQDLAQEIFLLIYKNIHGFKGNSSLSTWIYRVALNRCLDWQRANKHKKKYAYNPFTNEDNADNDIINRLPEKKPGPEDQVIKSEEYQRLYGAINGLSEKYKKVIVLYHFQQMSYKEIAEVLDLPLKTVETQLYRGKQRLRKMLTESNEKEVKTYEYI